MEELVKDLEKMRPNFDGDDLDLLQNLNKSELVYLFIKYWGRALDEFAIYYKNIDNLDEWLTQKDYINEKINIAVINFLLRVLSNTELYNNVVSSYYYPEYDYNIEEIMDEIYKQEPKYIIFIDGDSIPANVSPFPPNSLSIISQRRDLIRYDDYLYRDKLLTSYSLSLNKDSTDYHLGILIGAVDYLSPKSIIFILVSRDNFIYTLNNILKQNSQRKHYVVTGTNEEIYDQLNNIS